MNDDVRAIGEVTGDHGAPLFVGAYRGRVNVAGVMLGRRQLAELRELLDRAEREAVMPEPPAGDVTVSRADLEFLLKVSTCYAPYPPGADALAVTGRALAALREGGTGG